MTTNIICRLQVEGLHWWSEASKYEPTMVYLENKSCEMIAQELLEQFDLTYCAVYEDNENGAEIYG